MTEGWTCEGGHPFYLIDGEKICKLCEHIAEVGAKPRLCRRGQHAMAIGDQYCVMCQKYKKTSWHRTLDETGSAVCPAGHTVTHETMKYIMRGGVSPERRCRECGTESWAKAHSAYMTKRAAVAEAEGREMRHRIMPKLRLPADYCDWVVAYRLIMGKVDEVYDMMRGRHKGATAMEKWVAYHSTVGRDASEFVRTHEGEDKNIRPSWAEFGEANGWPPKTLTQAIAES